MDIKVKCPICGFESNPSGLAQHMKQHEKQPASTTLTRKLADRMRKKSRKGFMIDLSSQHGTFPQPNSESVEDRMQAIREMVKELNEIKLKRLPNIVAAVRSALNSHRARRKLYNKFAIAMN
jgi:hypothetical protein